MKYSNITKLENNSKQNDYQYYLSNVGRGTEDGRYSYE